MSVESVSRIQNDISGTLGGRIPRHVAARADALVAEEELVGIGGELKATDSGWVAAFTNTRVIYVEFTDSEFEFRDQMPDAGPSTVRAATWSRKELEQLSIEIDEGHNADARWNGLWRNWPMGSQVALRYANGVSFKLDYPSRHDAGAEVSEAFLELVRSLTADL